MNCNYLTSKAGILKLISVVLGLIATICVLLGYNESEYLSKSHFEEACVKGNEAATKAGEAFGAEVSTKPCPRKWMVEFALISAFICCAASLIFFIILLFVKLNENGCFSPVDFIGHIIAGLVFLIAGILCIVFVIFGVNQLSCKDLGEWCTKKRDKYFQTVEFGIGGAFCLINGIVYIIAAIAIKKS